MSKEEQENAIVLNPTDYLKLTDPKFEGQTRTRDNGDYSIYFSCNGKYYVRHTNLFI